MTAEAAMWSVVGVVITGIFALLGIWLKGRLDTVAHRRKTILWWQEGLANYERQAAMLTGRGKRPLDVQREAWFTSFATYADPKTLERIDSSYGDAWIREPTTSIYSPREGTAEDIQKEITRIAKEWKIH